MTDKDKEDLEFVASYADVVNVSFVNTTEDVDDIKEALKKIDGTHLGIIIKIETKQRYINIPENFLKDMQMNPIVVMIARG